MFIPSPKVFRRMMNLYLAGTRGGPVRLQIVMLLMKKPMNINEISDELNLNYKTVQHHVRVLQKLDFIRSAGRKYSNTYELSELLNVHKGVVRDISKNMGKA